MKTALRNPISLEANILWDEIYDAYREHPQFHGNYDVLRLLVAIQHNFDRSMGDRDEAIEAAQQEGYEDGEEQGYKCAIDEFFEPIDSAAHELIACIETDDPKLKAETPDAIADLKKALSKMEKEYRK